MNARKARERRQAAPARPTLTILYRADDTERIVFDCQHGVTTAEHLGGNGDTLRLAIEHVVARHAECRCKPEVVEDMWESMSYMKATTERDIAAATTDASVLALAHSHLDSISRFSCPCDPTVIVTTQLGIVKFMAYHQDGCTKKLSKEPHYSLLDFSMEGASA
jgi:hypothetical protein